MCIRSCDALLSMLLDLGKCKPCCSCFGSWRHPDPHPDVVFSSKWFSHLNAYASTCALHPNEYPNLAFPFALAVFSFSLLSTRFSRCCSICESANIVAVVPLILLLFLLWFLLLLLIGVLLLQLLLVLSLRSVHQAIDGAPYCFVPWRHPDPHPDVVFSSKCLCLYLCSTS